MPKVFISYRRSDTQMVAGRLHEALAARLGQNAIFRDKNSIGAGEDWIKAIEASLSGDTVVLALIGAGWTSAREESGNRRLDDPADWNRVELEHALNRSNRVIPLLVDDARMPRESELPETLRALARSNALKLRDDDWDADVERLVRALGVTGTPSSMRRVAVTTAVLAMIAAGGVGYWWSSGDTESTDTSWTKSGTNSSFHKDIHGNLYKDLETALKLLNSADARDKPKAIRAVDANLARINGALESFPDDAYMHALAGYASKNVFEASRENDLLTAEQRQRYLAQARQHFEAALKIKPKDPSALNGMGNVSFYEGRFDAAIRYHEAAIKENGGAYSYAEHDLKLVRRVKSGEVTFRP